jgi:tripartite-type tricarboxylate transporter receptor subunit TctC
MEEVMLRKLFAIALLIAAQVHAQQPWPSRAITFLTPFPPGPGPDLYMRPLLNKVGEQLGQTIIHEVRIGGAGALALQQAARSAPDGYTFTIVTNAHLIQRHLIPTIPDIVEMAHVSRISLTGAVLVVAADSPIRTFENLVATAKAAPGKLNYGSGGNGTPSHMQGASLAFIAGIDAVHVPFKNSAEVVPALIRGDLHFSFQVMSFGAPFVKSGKLTLLAVTSQERVTQFPDAPTLYELTRNDLAVQDNWSGLSFPAKTPAPIVRRFHAEVLKALADPAVRRGIETSGTNARPNASPEEFAAYVRSEDDKWGRIVKLSGVKLE